MGKIGDSVGIFEKVTRLEGKFLQNEPKMAKRWENRFKGSNLGKNYGK